MSIELTPVGVACNLSCDYCYQNQMREAGNITQGYNFEKMKAGLEREGGQFSIFGGEALLTPLPILEEIFAYGLERFGSNSIQSNGTLITDEHIVLFQRYKVHVGLSLDGPDELNDSRWAGTLEKTRAATHASFVALHKLLKVKIVPSIITTLYRGNAVGERLWRLMQWFTTLNKLGIRSMRIHLLEVENDRVRSTMALTNEENTAALLSLYHFQKMHPGIDFDIFNDMRKLLMAEDQQVTCIWNACDPYTTAAVRGVNGQGESSNCGRMNKEGVDWRKADVVSHDRQVALYHTPQEELGCQGCRFFFACKGQCPGTAQDGDWRNRSEHCASWMALFERMEADLIQEGRVPLSKQPELRQRVDAVMLRFWESGKNISIHEALQSVLSGKEPEILQDHPHGDHWDAPDGYQHADNPYVVHGDSGTTVMHGDSDASF